MKQLSRALKERDEARAFQAATNEILIAISRSTSDAKPVFGAIVNCVRRLFGTRYAAVFLLKGDELHLAAHKSDPKFEREKAATFRRFRESFPQRVDWKGFTGKALRSGKVSQLAPVIGNPKATRQAVKLAKQFGYDAMLVAPLMKGGQAIGAIGTTRPEATPFTARELALFKAFAAQAVIAIENARLFNETKEGLERQTATAEILKVIASSPSSAQPVFDAIASSALRLFDGLHGMVVLVRDDKIALASHVGPPGLIARLGASMPMSLNRESLSGRVILDRKAIGIGDVEASGLPEFARTLSRGVGMRALLGAPMLREGKAIGAIVLARETPGEFNPKQVALLETFADQAVIAIENARLFNETKEALEQQTSTADILKVISGSPTSVQPVFETIARNAVRLCDAIFCNVLRFDGELLHVAAHHGFDSASLERLRTMYPMKPDASQLSGRVIRERAVVHIRDAASDARYDRGHAAAGGWRRMLGVPMLREGRSLGVIVVAWKDVGATPEPQVRLLQTFADQAAIAIENVRLFNETREALERQTATAEILKVIASSPSDTRPIFDAIVKSAVRLCDAVYSAALTLEANLVHLVAQHNWPEGSWAQAKQLFPMPLDRDHLSTVAIRERRVVHVDHLQDDPDSPPTSRELARLGGYQTLLVVPMMKGPDAIGAIAVARKSAFSDDQIALLKTFADQAAIAIENVRLLNETKEALERQTATAEILKVISSTPTDVQPVFDAIVRNAVTLCGAMFANAFRYDGEMLHCLATTHTGEEYLRALKAAYPMRPDRSQISGRAILSRSVARMEDALVDPEYERRHAVTGGWRKMLGVPLMRDADAVGVIVVAWERAGPVPHVQEELLKTFADQAVIAIENVRLFNETKEALERQTATAEILKVIASSPSNAQPVFDAIASSALRLFDGLHGMVVLVRDDKIALASHVGPAELIAKLGASMPMSLNRESLTGRVILDRKAIGIGDVEASGLPEFARTLSRSVGMRALLGAPMLREGKAIGAIVLARETPGEFNPKQVALLETFADQAVIAIENARLFSETKEALERQTATSELLEVIGQATSDLQPVFDTLAENAVKVCRARQAFIFRFDGQFLRVVASCNISPELRRFFVDNPIAPGRGTVAGRAAAEGRTIHVHDVLADPEYGWTAHRVDPIRTVLTVPMIRGGELLGVIGVNRQEVRPFSEHEIELLQSFASQAVIAIENVRLFNETKEALERQTATAEVLKAIASSPSDTRPVFDVIAERSVTLCGAQESVVLQFDGALVRLVGQHHLTAEAGEAARKAFPCTLEANSAGVQAIRTGQVVEIQDVRDVPKYQLAGAARASGLRRVLGVPLMRGDQPIGAVGVAHAQPGRFSAHQIAMVQTFADQAVIAIENVRLFNETKEALERQTATAEILRVISGSPTDTRPVFDVIAKSAMRLFGGLNVAILLRREKEFVLAGYSGEGLEDLPEQIRTAPLDPEKNFPSRAILEGKVLNVTDWEGADVPEHERLVARSFGVKSGLMVPLLRQGEGIGAIAVVRATEGAFIDKDIALLQSFADQAVIAMENVRLFNETREALERQTATSEVLKAISRTTFDLDAVLKVLIENATRLAGAHQGFIFRFDGEAARLAYSYNAAPAYRALIEAHPLTPGRGSLVGRVLLERAPVHIPDVLADRDFTLHEAQRAGGFRSMLGVPMLREGNLIGVIAMWTTEVRPFTEKQVELVSTFADQAVIAMENVRLFNETKEALEHQTATAEVLQVISGSVADARPVFTKILQSCRSLFAHSSVGLALLGEDDMMHLHLIPEDPERPVEEWGRRFRRAVEAAHPRPARDSAFGYAMHKGQVLYYADVANGADVPQGLRKSVELVGTNYSAVFAPLLWEGRGIGALNVFRVPPAPFSEKEIRLLKTFADQAVIAIQNARLFNETREALEKQTATADILQVLSGSPSDTQPVFEAIVRHAARLCESTYANVFRYDGEQIHLAATEGGSGEALAALRASYPSKPKRLRVVGRVIETMRPVRVEDTLADAEYDQSFAGKLRLRRLLGVPLMRGGRPVGAITVGWADPGPIQPRHEDLLKTFADQAVIAIENVRLFNETKEALERQTATAEILKVISASTTDVQPVFEAIAQTAHRLFDRSAALQIVREGALHVGAIAGFSAEGLQTVASLYPMELNASGRSLRAMREGKVLETTDVQAPGTPTSIVAIARAGGFRSLVTVPLLRGDELLGQLSLTADEVRPRLDDKQRDLLKTFADQAVIAIENVRLFKELQARTEALTKSVGQLTALGEVGRAISSTLELDEVLRTIVQRAVQLAGVDGGSIYEFDERDGRFHLRAAENIAEGLLEVYRSEPIRLGEGAVGRAGATREPVAVEDVLDASYKSRARELLIKSGARALLAVPLLAEDRLLGALAVSRKSPGPFAAGVIDLLKTFATQSAVAIQNARLFLEIEEKSRELEEASRHKSHFLASMSHELRTPLNAILGFNEMILGQVYGDVPADMKEPLEDIQKSGKHLLRLINNVLDLAKIEAGRMELALADYSVQDTVESVRATLRPLAEAKGLELVASVPQDIPLAYGDGGRLTQCLMNLAGNSLKFTKEGRVEIAVEAENGLLRWRVSDTGIGIPPDKIPTLFSEFRQTDATIASEYGGTGLGLSITKKFVEMHGGRISVESELGKGSTFTLEIPLRVKAPA